MTNSNAAKTMYTMLKFQYAPLEAWLKKNYPEQYEIYLKASDLKKIQIMDYTANFLGL